MNSKLWENSTTDLYFTKNMKCLVLYKYSSSFLTSAHIAILVKLIPIKVDTVEILKFGTPQTIAVIVLKNEKFDVTLH